MSGIHEEYHATHAMEAALERRLARVREHEAEVRRIEQQRHASRIAALNTHPAHVRRDWDFDGCVYDWAPYPAPIGETA